MHLEEQRRDEAGVDSQSLIQHPVRLSALPHRPRAAAQVDEGFWTSRQDPHRVPQELDGVPDGALPPVGATPTDVAREEDTQRDLRLVER